MNTQRYARIAGGLYLLVIVGGVFSQVLVRGHLVVHGDAVATAHNIRTHELLFRMGFVVELFYCACNVPLILILYKLFKVVNRNVALMMVTSGYIATAIESVSLLAHIAPILLLGQDHELSSFTAQQLMDASYLSLQLFEYGFAVSLVFFGFDCVAMAYLVIHSRFFPRLIGVLLAIEGCGYLLNSFLLFIAPAIQACIFPYFSVTALAEIALCLWLLVMGVNIKGWQAQAGQNDSARRLPLAAKPA